ncbi:hypothetical protein Rhopal_003391-T1 [Rhodotorula paludigena]|uniref:Homeobox domain-containing protein n=1 Tax=Rhodotorula paludigena TaxID=86838 RepID=A0AAV5GCV8_9BASI|nr:hypothetical protein Rhopal_003391-T1 [Rhodotorula paludigena]
MRRPTMSTGAGTAPRAPSYGWQGPPAGHQHSQQHFHNPHALRHPAYAASQSAVRPPSPLHRSKSFHPSSSSASPAQHSWQHARPSGIVVPDSRPSLRRTHSKVSLASPTTASIPPSPAAPAFGSAADRHRTVRSNESGYRSLVRRASFSAMQDVRMEVDDIEEQLVPDLPREGGQYSHYPRPGFGSQYPEQQHDYGPAPRGTDNSNDGASGTATVLPPGDPRIPPSIPRGDAANPLIPNKRTVFTPYEMTLLLALWNGGRYYPSTNEVDEVIRRTGLQRVQIRN